MKSVMTREKNNKTIITTGAFQFNKSSLFLKDVPYVICGALSLIFNLNNNFIIKSND